MKYIIIFIAAFILFTPHVFATYQESETFDLYQSGSDVNTQGRWIGDGVNDSWTITSLGHNGKGLYADDTQFHTQVSRFKFNCPACFTEGTFVFGFKADNFQNAYSNGGLDGKESGVATAFGLTFTGTGTGVADIIYKTNSTTKTLGAITSGQWYLFQITWNKTLNRISYSVIGDQLATTTGYILPYTAFDYVDEFYFGHGGSNPQKGATIDDIQISDAEEFTPNQIYDTPTALENAYTNFDNSLATNFPFSYFYAFKTAILEQTATSSTSTELSIPLKFSEQNNVVIPIFTSASTTLSTATQPYRIYFAYAIWFITAIYILRRIL